ncbi:MAG: carbonic anhydrase [Acidimicrobiia bacterium]|nr:carbonic anhydrase [Acidimicrobiia bacterium]
MHSNDDLLTNAEQFAAAFPHRDLPTPPSRHLAVVTCMDSRIDLFALFGLDLGEAHVLRNAGAIVTDDVLRSLVISQRLLNTAEIYVVAHTECGLHRLDEQAFMANLEEATGERPAWTTGTFDDADASVRRSLALVRSCTFLVDRAHVRGFVYDVHTGGLREVTH